MTPHMEPQIDLLDDSSNQMPAVTSAGDGALATVSETRPLNEATTTQQVDENKNTDDANGPPRLAPDMEVLATAFRLNDNTRQFLIKFDARTLEDFSLMTEDDFIDMTLVAARKGRPLPPLQIRKLAVLLEWTHELVADATATATSSTKLNDQHVLIPPNWENRFHAELPMLRKRLQTFKGTWGVESNVLNTFINLQWLCGCGH